jgi:hypothetical protein
VVALERLDAADERENGAVVGNPQCFANRLLIDQSVGGEEVGIDARADDPRAVRTGADVVDEGLDFGRG